ncbi:hypothetical protein BDV93DRAFT_553711 [Ceratobasidium sp. AG-I]|nr:hypothetical protein BDV93DRAFT_553711 [Ceratobasidium sp. AG-I]
MQYSLFITHATLSTIVVLNGIGILAKIIIIGDTLGDVLIDWVVCAFVFSIFMFFIVLILRLPQHATRPHVDDLEATQHLLAYTVPPVRDSEPLHPTLTWTPETLPAYCTPVEALNSYSEETFAASVHSVPVAAMGVIESHQDDCTFATSPFTSPPVYTMEIFVSKEQVILHDDAISIGSYVSNFELDTNADEAEPKPTTYECPTRILSPLEISKLLQLCELAIMESNNELL